MSEVKFNMPSYNQNSQSPAYSGFNGGNEFSYQNNNGIFQENPGYAGLQGGYTPQQNMVDGGMTDYSQYNDFASNGVAPPDATGGLKGFLFGKKNLDGTSTGNGLLPMVQTFTGLASAYIGMKQYGLAKKSFRQNRKEFNYNYDAQRQTTNALMEGKARARHSMNPDHYETPAEYMAKNEIAERKG